MCAPCAAISCIACNLNAELGRGVKASEYFHAVLAPPGSDADPDPACTAHARDLANSFLASLK
jgi:hypothetical protein